jgi:hypothetical protein
MTSVMNTTVARRAPYPIRANHKRCAKCGKVVSRAAFDCRRCGKRQRVRPRTILLILSCCLVAGMFAVAGASVMGMSATRSVEPVALQSAQPGTRAAAHLKLPPPVPADAPVVSAADLWLAYAGNPTAANHRFKDRTLVVNGTVRSIDRDFDGGAVMRLTTGDPLETVNARMASRHDPAHAVLKGKAVELVCVGRGALIGAPSLGNCFVR